jgi:hypothetical protein
LIGLIVNVVFLSINFIFTYLIDSLERLFMISVFLFDYEAFLYFEIHRDDDYLMIGRIDLIGLIIQACLIVVFYTQPTLILMNY